MNDSRLEQLELALAGIRRAKLSSPDKLFKSMQLTRTQIDILLTLGEATRQTTTELAAGLRLTQSAVTQTVETLVRRGLVRREADPDDRRITRLALEAKGEEVTRTLAADRRKFMTELLSELTDVQVDAFIAAITKFSQLLEARAITKRKDS